CGLPHFRKKRARRGTPPYADPNDGSDDGRLGGADQITDDRLPVGDAVAVKVLAQRQPSRHVGKRGHFANGGDQSHAVLDPGRGAVAESLGRRGVVLGQGWQAKMTGRNGQKSWEIRTSSSVLQGSKCNS